MSEDATGRICQTCWTVKPTPDFVYVPDELARAYGAEPREFEECLECRAVHGMVALKEILGLSEVKK